MLAPKSPKLFRGHEHTLAGELSQLKNGFFEDMAAEWKITYETEQDANGTHIHVRRCNKNGSHCVRVNIGGNGLNGNIFIEDEEQLIGDFLAIHPSSGSSLDRLFVASDGNEYRWRFNAVPNRPDWEWTCTDSGDAYVASYEPQVPRGLPEHALRVEEIRAPMISEFLATLMIMCHIKTHNL